jgi:undecaprenyl diphosphate synthase
MDGNGRWAQERGLKRTDGHAAGEEALAEAVEGALEQGIEWLTLYAFSTENWRRPTDEVRFLMRFNEGLLSRRRDEFNEKGVRIRFIGRRDWRVPRKVMRAMDEAVALTAANRRLTLTIAFNYGAQCEIVDAVRQIVASGVSPGDVDEALISKHLYDPEMPDVDLWIRTSGEHRISNFLIWQSAYAEMLFLDAYWPEFRRSHMAAAVDEFHGRNRRFGGLDS